MTVLRTNVPIYFNAVNLFKCQFSKDPLKFLTDEMVSSFQQGRIPDIEYFIYQNWRTLPICVLTDTCCRHLNILNWWTRAPGRRRERPDTDCNQTCYLFSFHLLHSLFFHYIQQEQCIFKRVGILFLFFRHRVINNNLHTHNYWSYISYKTHVETTDHCSSWENALKNISIVGDVTHPLTHLDALHVQVAVVRGPLLVLLTRVLVVLVLAGPLQPQMGW